ncbi:BamA/OMP85 family outer membrane protein [Desulfurobacterium sp.]
MRQFLLLLFFILFSTQVYAEVQFVSSVPFPEYLKSELQNEASLVCKIDNCSQTIPKVLDILGFEGKWRNGKIFIEKNLIIKDVIFKNLPSEILKSSRTIKNFLTGQKFSPSFIENARLLLKFKLQDIGFRDAKVDVTTKLTPTGYVVIFYIQHGLPHQIEKIKIVCDDISIKKFIESQLKSVVGKRLKRTFLFKKLKQIEEHFVSLGYYNFEIVTNTKVYGEDDKKKSVELIVRIKPGKQYKIEISGNHHISTDRILAVLTFKRDRTFDEFEVEQSKKNIIDLYKNNGFPYAEVSVSLKELSKHKVLVVFQIKEGPFVEIRNVEIECLMRIDRKVFKNIRNIASNLKGKVYSQKKIENTKDSILHILNINGYLNATLSEKFTNATLQFFVKPGKQFLVAELSGVPFRLNRRFPFPYSSEFEEKLKLDVADYYRNSGYLDVKVNVKKREISKKDKIFLYMRVSVDKGQRYYIGFSLFAGLNRTHLSSLEAVRVVKPGSFYNRRRIIEQYSILSDTRIFSMVDLKEVKSVRTVNPVFVLKESPVLTAKGFIGYSTDAGVTVKGSARSSSPLGRAFSVFLSGEYRKTEGSNIFLRVGKSGIFSPRNRGYLSLIRKTEVFESFNVERYITRFEISRKQGKALKQNYGMEVSKEVVNDIALGKTKFYKRTLFIITDYDKRNSFSNPTKGYRFHLKLSYTGGFLGGDADYFLSEIKVLKLKNIKRRFTVVLRAGVGYIKPFGSGVPIQDRFYLGGAESVRGYKYGTISPVDSSGNYVGGNFYSLASIELRYNILKELQIAVFCDTGDVFPDVSDFTFDGWYSSVGLGFRYLTPVGPLRVDYGYKLKPIEGQGRGRFHISFGFPF